MKTFKNPPKKLSALLCLALNDLSKVEKDKRYKVNMDNGWHRPGEKYCEVCLAGAVMAKTLMVSPRIHAFPTTFMRKSHAWFKAFHKLNFLRQGHRGLAIEPGFEKAWQKYLPESLKLKVPPYKPGNSSWRKAMWKIVKELEMKNL